MTKAQIKKFLIENPEYETVEDFIQFLQDDERTSFTKSDIYHLQDATSKDTKEIYHALEDAGFTFIPPRPFDKSRGYKSDDHLDSGLSFGPSAD